MLPLSTAVASGDLVFLSGVAPLQDGHPVAPDSIEQQTGFMIRRMAEILADFDLSLQNMVYVQIYLRSTEDYAAVNAVYERMMPAPYPARKVIFTTFAVDGMDVEINGIASKAPADFRMMP